MRVLRMSDPGEAIRDEATIRIQDFMALRSRYDLTATTHSPLSPRREDHWRRRAQETTTRKILCNCKNNYVTS